MVGGPADPVVESPPTVREMRVRSLGQEDALEEGMAAHSSVLAWRIPQTEEPGGLQSMCLKELDTTDVPEKALTHSHTHTHTHTLTHMRAHTHTHSYTHSHIHTHTHSHTHTFLTRSAAHLKLTQYCKSATVQRKKLPAVPRKSKATQPDISPDGSASPWEQV